MAVYAPRVTVHPDRYGASRARQSPMVKWLILHTSEQSGAEDDGDAEALAAFMTTPGDRPSSSGGRFGASYHTVTDTDRLIPCILGPVDSFEWQDITLASGNWTNSPTAQWRYIAGRIELRGAVTRTTYNFAAGGTLFNLGTGNPPEPERDYRLLCGAQVAAETPDASTIYMFVDTSTGTFRSSTSTHNLAIGDAIFLDGIWWPA